MLGWLRKKVPKLINKFYPFQKSSSNKEDNKKLSSLFSHPFLPDKKFLQNLKLTSHKSKSSFKDLALISRMLHNNIHGFNNIFFRMKRKAEEKNSYNRVYQFYSCRKYFENDGEYFVSDAR